MWTTTDSVAVAAAAAAGVAAVAQVSGTQKTRAGHGLRVKEGHGRVNTDMCYGRSKPISSLSPRSSERQ
jgi:hypothetical protein